MFILSLMLMAKQPTNTPYSQTDGEQRPMDSSDIQQRYTAAADENTF